MNKVDKKAIIEDAVESILEKIDSYVLTLVDLDDDDYTRLKMSIEFVIDSVCNEVMND